MDISDLSLDEKIGQRFIMGINGTNINDMVELVKNAYIGGVVLYKKNYKTYDDMIMVINKLKEANKTNKLPLFIAIDQEGGRVNRIPKEIHNLDNIYDVSKRDINLVSDYADILARILKESGINMNFAPVLDIYNGSKSNALYKRCFYGNSDSVTIGASKYVGEMSKTVIPVIKHYPGHGLTKKDTHFMVPYIYNYKEFNEHVKPFNELIKDDVDAIMVGHLVVRGLSSLLPASISSKFLDGYLRSYYDGLIITDEINMLRRNPIYYFIYKSKALKADSDILLVKIKDATEGYKLIEMYKKILTTDLYCEKLDKSVERIVKVKRKYKLNDNLIKTGVDIDKINKEIDRING